MHPDDLKWLHPGEGDWHMLYNASILFGELLHHAGLVKSSQICGYKQLYTEDKATKAPRWRDLHG